MTCTSVIAAEGGPMTLAKALQAAAQHVERHKGLQAWSRSEAPSDEERARIAEVAKLGYELDVLAAASETAIVYRREYEAIRGELERHGFILPSAIAQAITDAFLAEAAARATPRRPSTMVRAGIAEP